MRKYAPNGAVKPTLDQFPPPGNHRRAQNREKSEVGGEGQRETATGPGMARHAPTPVERGAAALGDFRQAQGQARTDVDARRAGLHRPRRERAEMQASRGNPGDFAIDDDRGIDETVTAPRADDPRLPISFGTEAVRQRDVADADADDDDQ